MNTLVKTVFFTLIVLLISCQSSPKVNDAKLEQNQAQQAELPAEVITKPKIKTYYVLAQNGLNMRLSDDPSSDVIFKVPYGGTLKTLENTVIEEDDMTVENIDGQMVLLKHKALKGYLFDGFLSQFPAPKKDEYIDDYFKKLKRKGFDITRDSVREGDDGYYTITTSFNLPTDDIQEVFLLAQHLGPSSTSLKNFTFPPFSDKEEQIIKNPKKEKHVWVDNITVYRDESSKITKIEHYYRMEGGGTTLVIHAPKDGKIKLESIGLAD